VIAILDDPRRGEAIGNAARRRVQRLFTRQAMIDRLVDVYHEICPEDMSPR
jgi:glycosyltransferase involved in cell wall biosynthesis